MNAREQPNIGTRLRELRQGRGFSLRALAERCGLSANAISRIERGESSPTVSSLHRLAGALGVLITEFFEAEPELSTILVRKHLRLRSRGEGVLIESLGTGLQGQRLEPFLMTLLPGAAGGDEPITHEGEEFVYCVEGEVEYLVNEEWHRLEAGDSLLFLAPQPHMCRNTGLEKTVVLLVIQASEEDMKVSQQRHLMTVTS